VQFNNYNAIKITNHSSNKIDDAIVIEAPLQININNKPYTVIMRTPGDDLQLSLGLLYAEDIYKNSETPKHILTVEDDYAGVINFNIDKQLLGKGYLNKRTLLSVSSCGICGKTELDHIAIEGNKLANTFRLNQNLVSGLFAKMQKHQHTFKITGGSHACAIFNTDKDLVILKEDIGRHNAVDKCIGELLIQNQLSEAQIMLVSGRVSYEIISKAFFAKIPIIIAVSACSSLAIDYAKEFGICLIGFSRNHKMTIYANPQYINYEH